MKYSILLVVLLSSSSLFSTDQVQTVDTKVIQQTDAELQQALAETKKAKEDSKKAKAELAQIKAERE